MIRMTSLGFAVATAILLANSTYAHDSVATPSIEQIRRAYLEGRDQEAIVLADVAIRHLRNDPAEPQAEIHFWRGAALRRLLRFEEALVAFDSAQDLGFQRTEVHLERAQALRALGRQEEAEREFQEAEKRLQDDPEKLDDLRKRWTDGAAGDKKFQLRLNPTLGYDSNIIGLDKDTVLAEEVNRESFYYGVQLSARYLVLQEKEMALLVDYQNNLRGYASEPGLSYSDNLISLVWRSAVGKLDWLSYEVRASWGEAFLQDEGHFRTQRMIAPALVVRPSDKVQLRLWGDVSDSDYYEQTPDEQDRDGLFFRGGLAANLDLGDGWNVAPYFAFWRSNADGDDIDYRAWDFGTAVTTPEFAGFQFRLGAGVTLADYDHPHSLTNFAEERSDRRYAVRVTMIFRFLEKSLGFAPSLSFGWEKWTSNIEAFDFDRLDFGASADILAWSF